MTAAEVKPGNRRHHVFWTVEETDPLPILTLLSALSVACAVCGWQLEGWPKMALWATALYLAAKVAIMRSHWAGSWSFALLWPGLNLAQFEAVPRIAHVDWARRGFTAMLLGSTLIWGVARWMPTEQLAAAVALAGFIIVIMFGGAQILAAFWWYVGHDVRPIMHAPWAATSLADFWGRRWNLPFHDAALQLVARPCMRWLRLQGLHHAQRTVPVMLVFAASGVVHELVMSVPIRSGMGGPLYYFLLQGMGVIMEGLWPHLPLPRLRMWLILLLPLPLLIHPGFLAALYPLCQALGAW